jgi:hypothetical protein
MEDEIKDRIAIRELIDAYGHHADRREADKQSALFTPDGVIKIYPGEPAENNLQATLTGRRELAAAFGGLMQYDITTHLNGQNTVKLDGNSATGECYCMSHHLWTEDGKRILMIMSIRYYDTYVRLDGSWYFAERKLIIDWVDKRNSEG